MPKKIILTRSTEDNQVLAKQLLALNYSVIEFPAIKIVDNFNLNQAIQVEQYDCLVFTSGKAIQATRRYFENQHVIVPQTTLIAVVGQASAKVFEECFRRRPEIVARNSNSESLVEDLILKLATKQKILFLSGNLSLDILPRRLREQGFAVDLLEVYRNLIPKVELPSLREILAENPANLIFPFYSPSAVNNCIILLGNDSALLNKVQIISVGARTTAQLSVHQLVPKVELTNPNSQDLISALLTLI